MDLPQYVARALAQHKVELAVCCSGVEILKVAAQPTIQEQSVAFVAEIDEGVAIERFNEIAVYADGELIRKKSFPLESKHPADAVTVSWSVEIGLAQE